MSDAYSNYFIGNKTKPFHLFVGAVVLNDNDQALCYHFVISKDKKEVHSLMRETVEPTTSLEDNLRRGLMEEFGAQALIIGFLGAIQSHFKNWEGIEVQKTTIYFLCRLDKSKPLVKPSKPGIFEGETGHIEWYEMHFLIEKMKNQFKLYQKTDYDESIILERALNYINKNENDI